MEDYLFSKNDSENLCLVLGQVVSSCENNHNLIHPRNLWRNIIERDLAKKVEELPSGIKPDAVFETYTWLKEVLNKRGRYNLLEVKNYSEKFASDLVEYNLNINLNI
jgi:hypothetical protein